MYTTTLMKKINIYSQHFSVLIRIIAISAAFIMLISNIFRITGLDNGYYSLNNADDILSFSFNCCCIILCIILAIFPKKIELITIMSFLISIFCFFDYLNPMAICMYALGIATLLARGFFKKGVKIKKILLILCYFLLWLLSFRSGWQKFLIGILIKIAYTFTLILSYFFYMYYVHTEEQKKSERILNLANYPTLDARDSKILNMIKQHIKYEAIAPEVYLGVGALKNRLRQVYDTLEVGDKHGFLNKYTDFEIVYEENAKEK